jgi:hypothetical protein
MEDIRQKRPDAPSSTVPAPPPLAPVAMMVFWMLLGGAAGINVTQRIWHLLGLGAGEVSIAVPVGGVAGALLGLINNPRLLVLLMACRCRRPGPSYWGEPVERVEGPAA